MLVTIAAFLVLLGVLLTVMASSRAPRDVAGRRIPGQRAPIVTLVPVIGGVGLFAYILYRKAFGS